MQGEHWFFLALYVGVPVVLLSVTFLTGLLIGRAWDRSLERREAALAALGVTNGKILPGSPRLELRGACVGCCVGSIDYFRRFLGRFRAIFGGEFRSWSRILSRCRREAILRMMEEATRLGATDIIDVRIETSCLLPVSQGGKGVSPFEVIAYGTAVRRV